MILDWVLQSSIFCVAGATIISDSWVLASPAVSPLESVKKPCNRSRAAPKINAIVSVTTTAFLNPVFDCNAVAPYLIVVDKFSKFKGFERIC